MCLTRSHKWQRGLGGRFWTVGREDTVTRGVLLCCSSNDVTGLSYTFKPRVITGAHYKVDLYEDASGKWNISDLAYVDVNRHGIRIVVRQSGEFGHRARFVVTLLVDSL